MISIRLSTLRLTKMRIRIQYTAAVLSGLLCLTVSTEAQTIILSGDYNPVSDIYASNGFHPNDNPVFFRNVLGSGTAVGIVGNNTYVSALNTYYNSLPGVTSSVISGALTTNILSNLSQIVVSLPDNSFTASETNAVKNFLSAGKTLFVIGDNSTITNTSAINSDLTEVESSLRIISAIEDGGTNLATVANGQIQQDALTTGVNGFSYGALGVSEVTGGTSLLLESNRMTPFVTVERFAPQNSPVPEPGSIALLLAGGMSGTGWLLRQRQKQSCKT